MATLITPDTPLNKGEDVELVFNILGIFQQEQQDQLISAIQSDCSNNGGPLWPLRWNVETIPGAAYDKLHITCKVMHNPIILATLINLILTLAIAVFVYLSFDRAYKITKEAPVTAATGGAAVLIFAAIIFYLFVWK